MRLLNYSQPVLPLLLGAAVLLVTLGRRSPHLARRLAIVCVLLFLWSWLPFATLISGTLEWRYPVRLYPQADAQAMVVLSGGVYTHDASEPEDLPNPSTLLRSSYAAWLYRNWRPLPIVVTGGSADAKKVSLSEVMARVLEEGGIPSAMIWRENASRSTYENAAYSAAILRARGIDRIVLVTEAYHMRRAEACFRRQGLTVIPAPCCFRTLQLSGSFTEFLPQAKAITYNEDSTHEWLGILWYFVSGKI